MPIKSRRLFLRQGVSTLAGLSGLAALAASDAAQPPRNAGGLPLLDLHAHLDKSTIDRVAELGRQRGVRLGIVEHAGTKENIYPVVLSNDRELTDYLQMLEGKGVYRGVQTEWTDWMGCFSREALARLDYILTDAMTFPGKDGRRVKLWEKDAPGRVGMDNREAFMGRYLDWHLKILAEQPIDLLANVSWLPEPLAADYEKFWTAARVRQVARAAAEKGVALEISSGFRLPRLSFLRIAREERVQFAFGSNGRYPKMGQLDYSLEMAAALQLRPDDIFIPSPGRRKAIDRWTPPSSVRRTS